MPKRKQPRVSRTKSPKTRFLNPAALYRPPGYTHVVEIKGPARFVYIAGQLGFDDRGQLVGAPGDFRAQTEKAFENVKAALASVGAKVEHVVKINNYIVDIDRHIPIFREVRDRHMHMAAPPASTAVGVPALARAGALIEVEAIAILPA